MGSKLLLVYNSAKLFEILSEIKENFNFTIRHVGKKEFQTLNLEKLDNYLVISLRSCDGIKNCLILDDLPQKLLKLVEKINLGFLKNQFNNQSELKIGKYVLDFNSRKIYLKNISLDLTEKESDLLIFINVKKKASLKEIQKEVWGYSSNLETHTVETHIYRLRKKMFKNFNDDNFIKHDKQGYFLK